MVEHTKHKFILHKKIGVVHAIAKCETCGREFDNYKNAQAVAAQHAKTYGHRVVGEVGISFEYEGRADG